MLSRSLLKTKLVEFRDSREPAREEFGPWFSVTPDLPRLIGNRNAADTKVLNDWIKRCERENLDERLKDLLHVITEPELFRLVLAGRRKAVTTVNRVYGVRWKTATRAGEVVGLDSEWRKLNLKKELTAYMSRSNYELLERAYFLHSDYVDLAGDFAEEPSQRKGEARRNRLFWDFLGNYLQIRSGDKWWFDNEVAILTEIAFDLPDSSVSSEHITDARRQR